MRALKQNCPRLVKANQRKMDARRGVFGADEDAIECSRAIRIGIARIDAMMHSPAGEFDSTMALGPTQKQRKLPRKIVFFDAERTFEKARELGQHTDFTTPICQLYEAN